ncbi:MAG: MipA/OmpV family protein [Gammaproteobacteria bacterium]
MRNKVRLLALLLISLSLLFSSPSIAKEYTEPKVWGIAMGLRSAEIPYQAQEDTVSDVIPLIFYDDDGRFFLRGLTAGFRFYNQDAWQFNAIGRYRFTDIPAEYQNVYNRNAYDLGLQLQHQFSPGWYLDLEVMGDRHGRIHSNVRANYDWGKGNWELFPYANLRWKDADFNNYYYALSDVTGETTGSAFDFTLGTEARYHVASNFYLIGRAQVTALDKDTYDLDIIRNQFPTEIYLGIAFFNDKKTTSRRSITTKPYVRLAHGWATPSNLGEIIKFDWEDDPYNNQLTSIFYGHPLTDKLFGIPFDVYLTPGLVYHHSSEVQDNFPEYVLAVKAYYTFKWPLRWRLGAAEGLSYVTQIPYIENTELIEKGYQPSKLLNFLDFSLDMNLGDLFRAQSMKDLWFGWSIHHRSGIFETSGMFGRIKGGSNYNTLYLQYHW